MAEELEVNLRKWTAMADDDVDMRTAEGRQEVAKQRALLNGISFKEALTQVNLAFQKRVGNVNTSSVAKL